MKGVVLVLVLFATLSLLTESRPQQRGSEAEDDYYHEDDGHEGEDPYYGEDAPSSRRPPGGLPGEHYDENADAPMKPMPPGVPQDYNWRSADFDHLQMGILFDVVHRLQDASRCFRAATEFENTSLAFMNYGVSLQFLFKEEDAKAAFARAVDLDPTNERARTFLANPSVIKRGITPPDVIERLSGGKSAHNPGDFKKMDGAGQFASVDGPRLWEAAESEDPSPHALLSMTEQIFPGAPEQETAVKGRPELYAFLASDVFVEDYFERYPVLIHAGTGFSDALTFSSLLDTQYEYGNDASAPHRNVVFLAGMIDRAESATGLKAGSDLTTALEHGSSLHFKGAHRWISDLAEYALALSEKALHLPVTVDIFVHGPSHRVLGVHNDLHCTLYAQVTGSSVFRMWIHEDVKLAVRERHHRGLGKDEIDSKTLGSPYMSATLRPGDVLYIPRGVLYEVLTEAGGDSLYLAFNINSLWNKALSFTWESFLGAGKEHHHDLITTSYYKALRKLMDSNIEFRRSVPRGVLQFGSDQWKDVAKALVAKLVDELLSGDTLGDIQGHMIGAVDAHNHELKNVFSIPPERRDAAPPPAKERSQPPQSSKASSPPGTYQDEGHRSKTDL